MSKQPNSNSKIGDFGWLQISNLFRISNSISNLFVAFIFICLIQAQVSNLKRDQEVVFSHPPVGPSNCWDLTIRGCVMNPITHSRCAHSRRTRPRTCKFNARREQTPNAPGCSWWTTKAEGSRDPNGETEFTLPKTGANGDFSTVIQLSDAQATIAKSERRLASRVAS
jgi:hypothetical protein